MSNGIAAPVDVSSQAAVSVPGQRIFDAGTFDEAYFTSASNYAGKYDTYNPPHKIAGYLREIRALRPNGTLLDVGCAFGRLLRAASEHYTCEGVDISAYALGRARQNASGIRLFHSSIQDFQPGRTYDVVTCFDVLEHVPDLDDAIARLRSLMAPGGILAMAVPVYDSPLGWLFGLIDRDPTHVHRFTREDWLRRLGAAKLDPIVFKGILRAPLPGYFVHVISPAFRYLSSAIFVICRIRDK
jgi:SAM-dependent methyltransferase